MTKQIRIKSLFIVNIVTRNEVNMCDQIFLSGSTTQRKEDGEGLRWKGVDGEIFGNPYTAGKHVPPSFFELQLSL